MGNEAEPGRLGAPISRRELVKRAGVGAAGLALSGTVADAALGAVEVRETADAARTIKIGFISPRSGPLAGFGEPTPYLLAQARKAFAKGLVVGGKRYAVQIIDKDTTSDPVAGRPDRARADQQEQGRPHPHDLDAGDEQPGLGRGRGGRSARASRPSSRGRPGSSAAAKPEQEVRSSPSSTSRSAPATSRRRTSRSGA